MEKERAVHRYNYLWNLKDINFPKKKGKVFSCFACGGGSTMGYKLSGFDVIGCNEIDSRMNEIYVKNLHPRLNYLCDIREMVEKARNGELPEEMYNLDILDGSAPCSTFSTVGLREKSWGVEKKFREGQKTQVLDRLFFELIDLAKELRPKVVISENVKGILLGKAKKYVEEIIKSFKECGYRVPFELLNASKMGVPQRRERVFFIAVREDILESIGKKSDKFIDLEFNEEAINFGEFMDGQGRDLTGKYLELWNDRREDENDMSLANLRLYGKRSYFGMKYAKKDKPTLTLTGHEDSMILYDVPKFTSRKEVCCISTFPQDYDFGKEKPHYICGMSVPPIMMAQVVDRVYETILKNVIS